MSEISKVYKQYGTIAGKQYLVLFYSSMIAASNYVKSGDERELSGFKTRFDSYVKKQYGQDFFTSYCAFVKENKDNQKLIDELNKDRGEFLSKAIVDLAKEPETSVKKEDQSGSEPERKAAYSSPASAKQQSGQSNKSRHGSVNIKGMKADFDYDEPEKALPIVKAATFLQPHDAENWCVLGDLYAEKNDWKSALFYYTKAITKNPRSVRAKTGMDKAMKMIKRTADTEESKGISEEQTTKEEPAVEEVTYYFENEFEFILYAKEHKEQNDHRKVIWSGEPKYQDECSRGFKLIDQKQYVQAIDAYTNALKYNPVGVTARFEICLAYCQLHNLTAAREALKGAEPYVYSEKIVAKYYRCLGYILIEEENYKVAANVYQYSLYYEPGQQSAKQEMLFIVNKIGFEVLDGISDRKKVEKILTDAGIPLLQPILNPKSESDSENKGSD